MKVAIYARYSTDLQDKTSITGQVTNCELIAKSNEWQISKCYSDEAISGTMTMRMSLMNSVPSGSRTEALGPATTPTRTPARSPIATRLWIFKAVRNLSQLRPLGLVEGARWPQQRGQRARRPNG